MIRQVFSRGIFLVVEVVIIKLTGTTRVGELSGLGLRIG